MPPPALLQALSCRHQSDLGTGTQGRVLEPLQVGVEFFQIDLHGRRDEDFVVGFGGGVVLHRVGVITGGQQVGKGELAVVVPLSSRNDDSLCF